MKTRNIIIVATCISTAIICIALTFWGNYKNDGVLSPDAFYGVLATFIGICATIIVGFQIASFVKLHETEKQIQVVQYERNKMLHDKEKFQNEIKSIRKDTSAVFDVHLMIDEPGRYINDFKDAGADLITVHVEACKHLNRTIAQIKEAGLFAQSHFPNVTYWTQNWRKGGLSERRIEIIKEYNFYNQRYCGCEFSMR